MNKESAWSLVSAVLLTLSLTACEINLSDDNAAKIEKQRNHELEVACVASGRNWQGRYGCWGRPAVSRPPSGGLLARQTTTTTTTTTPTAAITTVGTTAPIPTTAVFQWGDRLPLLPPGGSAVLVGKPTSSSYTADIIYSLTPAEVSTQLVAYLKNASWLVASSSPSSVSASSAEIKGIFTITTTTSGSKVRILFSRPSA